MDAAALREYETALLKLQADLRSEIDSSSEARTAAIDGRIGRSGDTLHAQQLASEMNRRRQARLKLIPSALQRIRQGAFGLCAACRHPINTPRLNAFPEALFCINCQRDRML
ncbi:MAG: TraR/DksA C4-type zinc finger protein [Kiritimatiellia bacterium]|jgi:DnaK suppressor protein|nr:TraR/DksA C4-type zinc finger protein [Kiritimatiellia bacterium]